jgi:hypothetical protein
LIAHFCASLWPWRDRRDGWPRAYRYSFSPTCILR